MTRARFRTQARLTIVFAAALFISVVPSAVSAAGGDLDSTFGGDGRVTTDLTTHGDFASAIAIQLDGKIVVVGSAAWDTRDPKFAVARYHSDGTLDTSFGGGDGKVITNFTRREDAAYGVAIQPGGEIVVAGDAGLRTSDSRFAVARYTADGTLDATFSGDGKVMTQFTSKDDSVATLALQADGKIIVAGGAAFGRPKSKIALARYNPDGTLDATFGGDGRVVSNASAGGDHANALGIQSDDKIVAGGLASPGTYTRTVLLRFETDGTPDTSFSGDGKVMIDLTRRNDSIQGVGFEPGGNIVAAGIAGSGGSNANFALLRYLPNGSLDPSFSGDGKVATDFSGRYDAAWGIDLQSDGKIVACGQASGGGGRFALARYGSNGALDTTFSGDGKATTNVTPRNDFGFRCAIQTDDKIVLAGGSGWGLANPKFAVARYLPG